VLLPWFCHLHCNNKHPTVNNSCLFYYSKTKAAFLPHAPLLRNTFARCFTAANGNGSAYMPLNRSALCTPLESANMYTLAQKLQLVGSRAGRPALTPGISTCQPSKDLSCLVLSIKLPTAQKYMVAPPCYSCHAVSDASKAFSSGRSWQSTSVRRLLAWNPVATHGTKRNVTMQKQWHKHDPSKLKGRVYHSTGHKIHQVRTFPALRGVRPLPRWVLDCFAGEASALPLSSISDVTTASSGAGRW
jgi:hypothetical protein